MCNPTTNPEQIRMSNHIGNINHGRKKYVPIPQKKLTPTKQRNNKTDSTITGIQTEGEENISINNQME
jgi:hypothetical protein